MNWCALSLVVAASKCHKNHNSWNSAFLAARVDIERGSYTLGDYGSQLCHDRFCWMSNTMGVVSQGQDRTYTYISEYV